MPLTASATMAKVVVHLRVMWVFFPPHVGLVHNIMHKRSISQVSHTVTLGINRVIDIGFTLAKHFVQ